MNDTLITTLGICFIFFMTTAGAAAVFFLKKQLPIKAETMLLGFASGIMIAASVWSLLIPSMAEASETMGKWGFVPAVIGFMAGGLFLVLLDRVLPHLHSGTGQEEGPPSNIKKAAKLFLAVTIHNIPEGLAVGFAFGGAAAAGGDAAMLSALGLAIGIGIQNLPEGAAVALPMREAAGSRIKAFLYGAGSGAVEPIAAVIGFFAAAALVALQPWLLAFAAGAMIFVVAEDLIPDSRLSDNPHAGTWGLMAGFAIMMALEVALG